MLARISIMTPVLGMRGNAPRCTGTETQTAVEAAPAKDLAELMFDFLAFVQEGKKMPNAANPRSAIDMAPGFMDNAIAPAPL